MRLTGAQLHSLRLILVVGRRRNLLIKKDCYSANETTNQAVGGSNLSGRATLKKRCVPQDFVERAGMSVLYPEGGRDTLADMQNGVIKG